jgi:hypothetical protein
MSFGAVMLGVNSKMLTDLSQGCVVSLERGTGRPVPHPEDVTYCFTSA